jgi:hypothetical protein
MMRGLAKNSWTDSCFYRIFLKNTLESWEADSQEGLAEFEFCMETRLLLHGIAIRGSTFAQDYRALTHHIQ